MRLLPFERVMLRSDDPPAVVEAKLAELIGPPRFLMFGWPEEPFRGRIEGGHFKALSLISHWRNSWRPVILGDIVPAVGGTEVRLRLRMTLGAAAFMAVWFGGLGLIMASVLLAVLLAGFGSGGMTPASVTAVAVVGGGFAMALAFYGLMSACFWTEANKARRLLCERLGCREMKDAA